MDLIFRANVHSNPFSIKVGYSDGVLQIKEKIQQHKGIPVSKQTLLINGVVLPDDFNIRDHPSTSIIDIFVSTFDANDQQFLDNVCLDYSLLQDLLQSPSYSGVPDFSPIVSPTTIIPQYTHSSNVSYQSPNQLGGASHSSSRTVSRKVPSLKLSLCLKLPDSRRMNVELDGRCRVRKLKEEISQTEGIPIERITIYADGNELSSEHLTLYSCQLSSLSDLRVSYLPPPPPATPQRTPSCMKVVVKYRDQKAKVEVRAEEPVTVLKGRLQMEFRLPDRYILIHKQRVVEDDRSFMWNTIADGDLIQLFPGYVVNG